jgi:uncharacterized membrane protein YeiH
MHYIMEFISIVEIIGTVAFAVSGALTAIEKKLDYYGIVIFAIITSVGGGIVRDVLINKNLPASLSNPIFMMISIFSAALVIVFYNKIMRLAKVLQLFDAIGLGAFTAIGAEVAIRNGLYQPFVIITLAVLTGTGGGVIRDVFAKRIPFVFREEVYAMASIFGAILFIGIYKFAGNEAAVYACFAITLSVRLFCMKMNIHLNKVDKIYKLYKAA